MTHHYNSTSSVGHRTSDRSKANPTRLFNLVIDKARRDYESATCSQLANEGDSIRGRCLTDADPVTQTVVTSTLRPSDLHFLLHCNRECHGLEPRIESQTLNTIYHVSRKRRLNRISSRS